MTTYVLVHGGGSTGRFWDRLVPHLPGRVIAVDMPGRAGKPADLGTQTVDDEVASIVADLRDAQIDDDIVLVVHSSGGLVTPGVIAALDGQVKALVLNAASIPPEGGCGIECMQPRHREGLVAGIEAAREAGIVVTTQGAPADPEAFRKTYGGDLLDDETLAYVVDPVRCVVDTVNHYFQPVHWSQAGDVPITYVVNERDRPVPAELQDEMVSRLATPPRVVRLDTGHIPAVTDPEGFAAIVADAYSANSSA